MNEKIKRGLCGLVAMLMCSSVEAIPQAGTAENAANKHLEDSAMRERVREKENWSIAGSGAPMESRIVEQDYGKFILPTKPKMFFEAKNDEVGYFMTLEDESSREGYLIVGDRPRINALFQDMKGSSLVQILIRDFKRDYWPRQKLDGSLLDPLDRVYGSPIEIDKCTLMIYELKDNSSVPGKKEILLKVRELRKCYDSRGK
ncbi:MAG: hypothetical protein WCK90_01470 [archaeon]